MRRAVVTGFWLVAATVATISVLELSHRSELRLAAEEHATPPMRAESPLTSPAVCLTYPHALVLCGLSSEEEFERVRASDAQLREHYSEVGFVRPEVLKSDELDYVSYRLGSKIVWTSKRLPIHAGEMVLKDRYGNTIRGRCGNRLSRVPMMPAAPDLPPEMEFERPSIAGLLTFVPEMPPELAPVVPIVSLEAPLLPPYVEEAPPEETNRPLPFIPLIPLLPILPIALGGPGGTPNIGVPVTPVPTPEPGTVWLTVTGLLMIVGGRYRRSRRHSRA